MVAMETSSWEKSCSDNLGKCIGTQKSLNELLAQKWLVSIYF